ncbi:MAG: CDP-diacylglycerol--glycerol-3-phosphate 3-phosphatidyltransferase [Candidatus Woesearchaeota archaeon]
MKNIKKKMKKSGRMRKDDKKKDNVKMKASRNILNIPNQITIARIILIPIFILTLFLPIANNNIMAAFIFLIIALTDHLDGYLARKLNQITDFGKLIDPLADKLLVLSALVFLIGRDPVGIPAWIAYLLIVRDMVIIGLRSCDKEKVILSASWWGKSKTVAEMVGIFAVLLNLEIGVYILVLAVILSWISGIIYIYRGRNIVKGFF